MILGAIARITWNPCDKELSIPPQIDGQTERVNQILEDMLRACVLHYGKD
jgi:hypothetical protein